MVLMDNRSDATTAIIDLPKDGWITVTASTGQVEVKVLPTIFKPKKELFKMDYSFHYKNKVKYGYGGNRVRAF
jgi:hypothetical protein